MSRIGRLLPSLGLIAIVLGVAPGVAQAQLELGPGDITVRVLDAAGNPDNRAGAHPDRLEVVFAHRESGSGAEDVKEMWVDFPPGLSGDPRGTPFCTRKRFEEDPYVEGGECPPETQVGVLVARQSTPQAWSMPVFNLEPGPNEIATIGIQPFLSHSKLIGSLRQSDYGFSMSVTEVSQDKTLMPALDDVRLELWGVPADNQQTSIPRRPFLTLPTRCDGGPLEIGVRIRTWQQPGRTVSTKAGTGTALTGCQELGFSPRVEFELGNPVIDSPSGARLSVSMPYNEDPGGRVESQIREASVALPEGTSLSPGVAAGLGVCSDAQLGLGTEAEAACPPSSKVGSVELVSPPLGEALTGSIYLRPERPGDRFRLAMVANARGTEIKLTGSLRPDPVSGRLVAHLSDLPQAAFTRLSMRFDGGPRALLTTSLRCGPAIAAATFTPYSGGASVSASAAVTLGGPAGAPCATPFAPTFFARGSSSAAGGPTAFSMTMRRQDREQVPDSFNVTLPPGLSADLGSVKPCAMANPAACTAESRIGSAVVEAGSGLELAALRGDVFLTGPYRRAPFGLAMVFRALLGPFDLGTTTIRSTLEMDSRSGQMTVQTDSLPTLVEGVPIRLQTLGMDIDRPGFMRNPTSCGPATIAATLRSSGGATVKPTSRLAVTGCGALRFRPTLGLALSGKKEIRSGGRPGLRLTMRSPRGGANLRAVDVRLPRAMKLDPSTARLCSRRDALGGNCPAGARVGVARAASTLLGEPLTGAIYAAQPSGSGSPDLWVELAGSGLDLSLRSGTAVEDGRLHTRLTELPDVPISKLSMRFSAGKRGVFSLRKGICRGGRLISEVSTEGQNGAYGLARVPVTAPPSRCANGPGERKQGKDEGQGTGRRVAHGE